MLRSYSLVIVLLLALVAGCQQNPLDPTALVGRYRSTHFILPGPADGPYDVTARGGFVELTLNADGTANAHQNIPFEGGEVSDTKLTGTYTVAGDSVTLDFDGNTWLEFAPLVHVNTELHSAEVLMRGPYELILKKLD